MPLLINREIQPEQTGVSLIPFAEYLLLEPQAQAQVRAVQANGDDALELLLEHAGRFELIALELPVLRDGRPFSIARELRVSGYRGQIRAVGATSRDKLIFLERCGFDAVELDDSHFKREDLEAYTEISVKYQGAVDQPLPIYRQQGAQA